MTSGPEWLDPVGDEANDREAGTVEAALLTTYNSPDATLLVEDLLPRWFGLDREMSSDDAGNRLFLAELEAELQRRRGKLAVFSSAARLGPENTHWIWSHVTRHFVGARGPAVQHAKLWLFHRVDNAGAERLDIHVSSTNLTRSALREQVQAGFRCIVLLKPTTSSAALRSWGGLIPFLQELGSHAGPAGVASVAPWMRLFARCRCPEGVIFIASVPGTHRGSYWGVRALGKALRLPAHSSLDILVPTVGHWTKGQIKSWAKAIGTLPKRVGLAWVPKGHPWAKHWQLPAEVVAALKGSKITLLALGEADEGGRERLHHRFGPFDDRWPHAKVYWFERVASPRVLVTSANWSPSAWGIVATGNQLHIENFELGVLLSGQKRPLRTLKEMTVSPATVNLERDTEGTAPWAHATFDGHCLVVQTVKGTVVPREITVVDPDGQRLRLRVRWKSTVALLETTIRRVWKIGPSVVVIMLGAAEQWLPVQDLRPAEASQELPLSRPPGIDEDDLKRLRAAFLEERYGGKFVDEDPGHGGGPSGAEPLTGSVATAGDYSVWLLDEARRVLAVVDTWVSTFAKMQSTDFHDAIERDGRELLKNWREEISSGGRRNIALKVACDELSARLRGEI